MRAAASIRCFEADLSCDPHRRAVADLVNMYAREPIAKGGDLPPHILARLIPFLSSFPTAHVILAQQPETDGNSVTDYVGVAVCVRSISTFTAAPVLNVHDLAVRPDARGQGVGTSLLSEAQRVAAKHGCSKITLEVDHRNAGAIKVYRRFGFADGVSASRLGTTWYLEKRLSNES